MDAAASVSTARGRKTVPRRGRRTLLGLIEIDPQVIDRPAARKSFQDLEQMAKFRDELVDRTGGFVRTRTDFVKFRRLQLKRGPRPIRRFAAAIDRVSDDRPCLHKTRSYGLQRSRDLERE